MALLRVLRTARATLTRTFYLDEMAVDADATVTVTVTRLDGTAVDTQNATGPDPNHQYSYTFPGRDVLDLLHVVWTLSIGGDAITLDQDEIEVCGGNYFTLTDARNIDPQLKNTVTYPTSTLAETRIEVEDECERITDQAWVPRFAREVLDGQGRGELRLFHPLVRAIRSVEVRASASSAYIPFDTNQLAAVAGGRDGVLRLDSGFVWSTTSWWVWGWLWPLGRENIIVEYEHGNDFPPSDIRRASKRRFKSMALGTKSGLPDTAERIAVTEMGTVLLASPDIDKTGLPEVDATYARHPSPRPGFG